MSSRLTIRQLYQRYPRGFVIGAYQRHYVWGQPRQSGPDAVTHLTRCLIDACRGAGSYFLQSVTVRGDSLVDGQQRITYLYLLLRELGCDLVTPIAYQCRRDAQCWLSGFAGADTEVEVDESCPSQDIYYFCHTVEVVRRALAASGVERRALRDFVLDHVEVFCITIDESANETAVYQMMNGTKAPMLAADIIKADMMRLASMPAQPRGYEWELNMLRARYAAEWGAWTRWWCTDGVRAYYAPLGATGLDLLLALCLRDDPAALCDRPLAFAEYLGYMSRSAGEPWQAAKHLFAKLREVQHRMEDAYASPERYNRIRAILLLQPRSEAWRFLHLYFVGCAIDAEELVRYYKLSFLGMTVTEIHGHEPEAARFDDLLASLSMADVYHSDTKRDVFNLLLRLNIDEDIKLGRRFDFSVWDNRSLEHIYSKSKVWHTDAEGRVCDGNDNPLPLSPRAVERDRSYLARTQIVNHDGTQLSEHCIGNLVLLYGSNNAVFGNAGFEQKKAMFLTPGDMTVFESRNLLHTVCVFAGNSWDHRSIVDNYNLTLKNLKIYYGFK